MKRQDPSRDEPLSDADVKKAYGALPGNDVPAELDARILARAREAAGKPSNVVALKLRAIRRWATPLAAAASVVVVMSVVYEIRFRAARDSSVATTAIEQDATPLQDGREQAPAAPAPEPAAEKPASARAKQRADATRANSIPPPPAVPGVNLPPIVSLAESVAPAPVAPVIAPLPSPAAPAATEPRQESKETEHGSAGALAAQTQLLSKAAAKQADAKQARETLEQLAGHYDYESYGIVMPSGRVLGLKELGCTAATLDIDAQGTLTLRMTTTNGKVVTQTAKISEVKLDGNSGYWIAQWPDMSYPIKAEITLEGNELVSTTRFVNPADGPRFGSMEQATLQRDPNR